MKRIQLLQETLEHMEYYNGMAPFPVYDTELVEILKEYINIMSEYKKDIDNLPVTSCKHCKSLYILEDEIGNTICGRCGASNEVVVHKTIHKYNEEVGKSDEGN